MNREMILNSIPKPENKDVILYDTTLSELINIDVFKEYKNLLPIHNLVLEQFLGMKNNIENYEKVINETYLYKRNWGESDYLLNLQNDKKTYATLFNPIKKIENNIEILKKKVKIINEKIELQTIKENKQLEDKKNNIDNKINQNLNILMDLKEKCATLTIVSQNLDERLKNNEEDFNFLRDIIDSINNGECRCKYCGSKLTDVSKDSLIYKRAFRNLNENKEELENILKEKQENDNKILNYKEEMKKIKEELNNDTNFKKQDLNAYKKKSIEILRLEGNRDSILKNIEELQKQLESIPEIKSKQFLELKSNIEKYETSLENLKKIKQLKENLSSQIDDFNKTKKDLKDMQKKLDQYKKFIIIYYKICEQKAAEFCGKNYKFSFFDFENYTLIETFEIYYNGIKFENLNTKIKNIITDELIKKFAIFD